MPNSIEMQLNQAENNPEMDEKEQIQNMLVDLTVTVANMSKINLFHLSDAIKDAAMKQKAQQYLNGLNPERRAEIEQSLKKTSKPIYASSYHNNQI